MSGPPNNNDPRRRYPSNALQIQSLSAPFNNNNAFDPQVGRNQHQVTEFASMARPYEIFDQGHPFFTGEAADDLFPLSSTFSENLFPNDTMLSGPQSWNDATWQQQPYRSPHHQLSHTSHPSAHSPPFSEVVAPEIHVDTAPSLPHTNAWDMHLSPHSPNEWASTPGSPNFPSDSSSAASGGDSFPRIKNSASPDLPSSSLHGALAIETPSNQIAYSPAQQAQMFKEMPLHSPSAEPRGPFIPQQLYRPHSSSDRRRYVDEVPLDPPIVFDLQNPDERGIPLRDALTSRFMRLMGRDDPMFVQRGPSISVRLMWPGYGSWSRQIPTRDFRSPPGPITRSKLAKNVAKSVARFIKEMQTRQMEDEADPRWRVGPRAIEVEDLHLVSLHHVSMGSWQAHLRLARP